MRVRPILLLLGLSILPLEAIAQQALPHTRPGKVLTEWMEAFNSADAAKIAAFNQANGQTGDAADTLGWRAQTGEFSVEGVESSDEASIVAVLHDDNDPDERQRVRVGFTSKQAAPKIEFEGIEIPRRTQADALTGLMKKLDGWTVSGDFSGAVLIARNGKVLLRRAWGLADREVGESNRPDSRFRVASVGKMFTAVAVMQLVERGRIALDAPVGRYLPDYPNAQVREQVKVRDLLTHYGGIAQMDYPDEDGFTRAEYATLRQKLRTHADYVAYYGPRRSKRPPGEKMEYNNLGFIVLGAIIERVSGTSYYDYVERKVLRPAHMRETGYLPETQVVPGRVEGYTRRDGQWVSAADTFPWRGGAAGGCYSTVDDLLKFAQALQRGLLLKAESLREATRAQVPEGWYGYGFITVGKGPLRRYGHTGDAWGMSADVRFFPESGYVLISLSNLDESVAYRPARWYEPRMPLAAP